MENVFLFPPNLLGYARIALALVSVATAFQSSFVFCLCYALSQILDALDGHLARALGQATQFGAVLDQVTDRLSTVNIFVLNAMVWPNWYLLFLGVMLVDLGGHWVHTFATLHAGKGNHKMIANNWTFLKFYYENKPVMFTFHAGYETAWTLLFLASKPTLISASMLRLIKIFILYPSFILAFLKTVTNVLQLIYGAQVLAEIDRVHRRRR